MSDDRASEPEHVLRVVHLVGGLRAMNPSSTELFIVLDGSSDVLRSLPLRKPSEFLALLRWFGFSVVGTEFDEVGENKPLVWRSYDCPEKPWSAWNARDLWGQIAYGAHKAGDTALSRLASRIEQRLIATDERLLSLSRAYGQALRATVDAGTFQEGPLGIDGHTGPLTSALHAFVVEACTLRDGLAAYLAHVGGFTGKSITRIGSLLKVLKPTKSVPLEVTEAIFGITDKKSRGWLAELGAYRDIFIHYAPLPDASHMIFPQGCYRDMKDQHGYPMYQFPIPLDPIALEVELSKGANEYGSVAWAAKTQAAMKPEDPAIADALSYCRVTMARLADLSRGLADLSPVAPRRLRLIQKLDGSVEMD